MLNYLEVPTNYESAYCLATLDDEFLIPPPTNRNKKVGWKFNDIHNAAAFLGILI